MQNEYIVPKEQSDNYSISNFSHKTILSIKNNGELIFGEDVHPKQVATELSNWVANIASSRMYIAKNLLLLAQQIINEGVGSKEVFNSSLEEFLKEIGHESNYQ